MRATREPRDRAQRLARIRTLLRTDEIASQDVLAERLRGEGYPATQSSVSRDLHELGVAKVQGVYRLAGGEDAAGEFGSGASRVADAQAAQAAQDLRAYLTAVSAAGPHLLVVHTRVGAASRCALALDRDRLPGVVGTLAGDDTIFVACLDRAAQRRVQARLRKLMQEP